MTLPNTIITYAQNREDIILWGFFSDLQQPGFYVDVGANHPEDDSVTKFFYERGWTGINIEPMESFYKLLQQHRPRDINLNIGVSNKPGRLKLREYQIGGLSTFSPIMKKRYIDKKEGSDPGAFREYYVPVKTLKQIFDENNIPGTINFLKIDVEGLEFEVLKGNDWKKYRPQVICIESNHILKDWRPFLKQSNYKKIFFDGLNDYYVANECTDLIKKFSYPEAVLLGPRILDKKNLKSQARFDDQTKELRRELIRQQLQIHELKIKNQHLDDRLSRQQSLRRQIIDLYRTFDSRVTNSLNARSVKPPKPLRNVSIRPYSPEQGHKALAKIARSYDTKRFFKYSAPASRIRLRYIAAAKMYKVTRDSAKKTTKLSYRALKKIKG